MSFDAKVSKLSEEIGCSNEDLVLAFRGALQELWSMGDAGVGVYAWELPLDELVADYGHWIDNESVKGLMRRSLVLRILPHPGRIYWNKGI